jgi:hypothetical protein
MDFVQNDVFMRTRESEFTQLTRVDLQLRGNNSSKLSKKLKLSTCASISVHMVSDLEILKHGFCPEYNKLSKMNVGFQN